MARSLLALLLVAFGVLLAPASSAVAAPAVAVAGPDVGEVGTMDASSCNYPSWGPICINVSGSGLFASRITASHIGVGWICDKDFHVWGYYQNGAEWHRNATAGCGLNSVWVQFDLNAYMKDGSTICADMKDHTQGSWHANGFACVRIHA
jgi:hypothetical protein